jgi:hypothetical protein
VTRTPLRPDLADSYERFVIGKHWSNGPLQVRFERGTKFPGDIRADIRCLTWHSVRFGDLGLLFDFLYENEHRRYPPRDGYEGGEYLRTFLEQCVQLGWTWANDQLVNEKERRRRLDSRNGR